MNIQNFYISETLKNWPLSNKFIGIMGKEWWRFWGLACSAWNSCLSIWELTRKASPGNASDPPWSGAHLCADKPSRRFWCPLKFEGKWARSLLILCHHEEPNFTNCKNKSVLMVCAFVCTQVRHSRFREKTEFPCCSQHLGCGKQVLRVPGPLELCQGQELPRDGHRLCCA